MSPSGTITAEANDLANRRILRLALGTALAMAVSQLFDWPLSFITPIIAGTLLSLPLPRPSFKLTALFLASLAGIMLCSFALLPYLYYARIAAILLIGLGLFNTFLFTASGGSALLGTLFILGFTLLTTIGSVNIDALLSLTWGLLWAILVGFVCVWFAHILLPEIPLPVQSGTGPKQTPAEKPLRHEAIQGAFRALTVVFPITILLLISSNSSAYTVIMIKVATMGQQASASKSKEVGRELIASTIWGGGSAIIAWFAMKIFPSLVLYILLIALSSLIFGKVIFKNAGMHPKAAMWQYAFITMMTVLAPTVGSMANGTSASDKFWLRLAQFFFVALYGWVAVSVLDAFARKRHASPINEQTPPT
ncbi:DUF2955 domain-containing protein [Desulfogranum japonicum]|uniref:DUF2955 domain-containing protein n=1 Tax=Desulfogranum japonicum TaxID=231447 RepID=UPI000424EF1A|nr:DUF2955 domain-containing protein [Desulfogranum japonicum]